MKEWHKPLAQTTRWRLDAVNGGDEWGIEIDRTSSITLGRNQNSIPKRAAIR